MTTQAEKAAGWPATPASRAALAWFATAPEIRCERHVRIFAITADEWLIYTGPQAAVLYAEREAELTRAMEANDHAAFAAVQRVEPLIWAIIQNRTDPFHVVETCRWHGAMCADEVTAYAHNLFTTVLPNGMVVDAEQRAAA